MFTDYPSYPPYRTLCLTSPPQIGEDVYALQTALNECGFDCGQADGTLGTKTSAAIKLAQKLFFLGVDGKAGGLTQKALAMEIAAMVAASLKVPAGVFRGQLEHESGYRLGNYSAQRADRTYDAGVAQRNTKFTSPSIGFDTKTSIRALGEVVQKHYDLFAGVSTRRRWALAQGAWNAPAFACYLAREEGATKVTSGMTLRPSDAQRKTFEAYISNVSIYLSI